MPSMRAGRAIPMTPRTGRPSPAATSTCARPPSTAARTRSSATSSRTGSWGSDAMDFELDEDQVLLRDSLQRLLAQEYSFEARRRVLATPFGFDAGVWQSLAQQGVLSVGLPEEQGGIGGPVEVMVVMEELGRALVLEPFASTVVLGANLIAQLGSEQQRAHWLPQVAAGECRLAFAHAEPQAR